MEQRTKLDPAKKARIVKALREGGYDQAYNALASNALTDAQPAQFCALGVMCEEFRREHPDEVMWVATCTSSDDNDNSYYEFALVPCEKYLALKEQYERDEIDGYSFGIECERLALSSGNLPAVVAQWLGMEDVSDAGTVNIHVRSVADNSTPALTPVTVLNDERKFPLERIAELIEQDKEL